MDNLSKILGGLLVVALVYIVFLQGCGGKRQSFTGVITVIDSVTVVDTVRFDTTTFKYVTVKIPMPYYDTVRVSIPSGNYFDDFDERESDCDFMLEYPSVYEDTIRNDTISIHYRATVRGYLDELKIGYKIFTPYYIESITTIEKETIKIKRFNGLYGGFDVGISKTGLVHFSPTLEASGQRFSINIGYDVYDKAFIGGIKTRIRLKRE